MIRRIKIMETKYQLGQKVTIKMNSQWGIIRGIWFSLHGDVQYNVRYSSDTNAICDEWFFEDELVE